MQERTMPEVDRTLRQLTFGHGMAEIDPQTGAIAGFSNLDSPKREYLIDADIPWHSPDFYWGTGMVVTSKGSCSWITPTTFDVTGNVETLHFDMGQAGLELDVTRSGGDALTERYVWRNVSGGPLTISQLSIEAPFNNYYPSAQKALDECVNAHIFAGGSWAWCYAEPMDGSSPSLGMIVRKGALHSYSLQTQNESVFSNVRGHIVLNVTDHAISPDSFGGQPILHLQADDSYELVNQVGWYASREAFEDDVDAPASFSALSSTLGEVIDVETALDVSADNAHLSIEATDRGYRIGADEAGSYYIHLSGEDYSACTEVLFYAPLEETVASRVHYILDHQVASYRPGTLSAAIVSVDTRTKLQIIDPFWNDWTDGSERICMPVLLQKALNHGYLDDGDSIRAQRECDAWRDFAERNLLDASGASRRGSSQPESSFGKRLYDMPWIAQFYCEHFRASGDMHDLDMASRILNRLTELGGQHFLSIEFAETCECTARLLREQGRGAEADGILDHVLSSADFFLGLGRNLPPHEVAYEQSVVAPLISLLIGAYRITGESKYLDGIRSRLPWLLSFSGFQPDCRLNGVAIRHWDGHWFGIYRSFGDTFPHYWSALTAEVLLRLPEQIADDGTRALAARILRANMANYDADGGATCAYIFPSSVDGRAMNRADPLANDQDEHLNIWLRMIEEEHLSIR
ncbi:hypothetical protein [Bifidobacterium sp.]|uniref:hypothetical protein n=1 Tax=Bifidobacterium sp. TaxID=41200 RepID=UPI0039EACEB8